jgi:hypothetical protein
MSVWANVNTIIVSVNTYSFASVWWFYIFFANSFTICKALLENKGVFPPDTRQVLQEKIQSSSSIYGI